MASGWAGAPQGGVPGTGPLAPPGLRLQSEARSPLQEIGRQWASPKPFLQLHPCPHTALGPHWAAATSPSSSPPLTSAPPARPLSSQCGSQVGPGGHHTKTLARASAPALAMRALLGWQATAWIASSCFLRWAVISCTHVLLSRLHKRREQSWPAQMRGWFRVLSLEFRGHARRP